MTAKEIIAKAQSQLGVKEKTGNNDGVPYNTWYYGREVSGASYPWCMVFVQWVFAIVNFALPFKTASCSALLNWYKKNKPEAVHETGKPGDIVIFNGHTGIVEDFENGPGSSFIYWTIEGNYSNKVARVKRTDDECIAFIRPDYVNWPDWAAPTMQKLMDKGAMNTPEASYDLMRTLVILDRLGVLG